VSGTVSGHGDSNIAHVESGELRTNIGGTIDVVAPGAIDGVDT